MKLFLKLIGGGVVLLCFVSVLSFLGDAASQRSDFGVVAGAILVIVLVAAAVAITVHYIRKAHP